MYAWQSPGKTDLLFVDALFGLRVKHLIRPAAVRIGAVRIGGSRALEQAVRAIAALFKEHAVQRKPFFVRALT